MPKKRYRGYEIILRKDWEWWVGKPTQVWVGYPPKEGNLPFLYARHSKDILMGLIDRAIAVPLNKRPDPRDVPAWSRKLRPRKSKGED